MSTVESQAIYEFGEFALDPAAHVLCFRENGKPVPASSRVVDTLLYFVEHRGELLEKSTLIARIWPNVVVEENNLNQHISAIRRTLGEQPGDNRYILTVPGRGYRFVSEVSKRAADGATASLRTDSPAPRASIAVLPFASLGEDPERQYFGDGMAEELIHVLSRLPGLRVPARTSSFAYKGRALHVQQIGRELGVSTVLEGSVRGDGNRIRVTAQLVDARTGYHLWSQTFDREFHDLFRLQDDLARSIVQALATHLEISFPALAGHTPPAQNLPAYQCYVQASALQARPSEQTLRAAIALYREATRQDPRFARAYSGAAVANQTLVSMAYAFEDVLSEAEYDARRALAIDPGFAEPHGVLGAASALRAQLLAADTHLGTARFLDASDPRVLTSHSIYVAAAVGHMRKAHQQALLAYGMAPAYVPTLLALAFLAVQFGRNEEALHFTDLMAGLGFSVSALPIPFIRSQVAWRSGRYSEAAGHASALFAREPEAARISGLIESICQSAAGADRKERAARELRQLTLDGARRILDPLKYPRPLMLWATLLGDIDLAYDYAGRMSSELVRTGVLRTSAGFCNQFWLPEMEPLRRDVRFNQLAESMGLAKYWAVHGMPDSDLRPGGVDQVED